MDEPEDERVREIPRADEDDGVDVTLIRWLLDMTPEQRLQVLQDRQNAIEEARAAAGTWTSERS